MARCQPAGRHARSYPATANGGDAVVAIDDVSLDIEAGDVYGIIGYSGAGKSTLVRLINALEPVTAGSILVDGQDSPGCRRRSCARCASASA